MTMNKLVTLIVNSLILSILPPNLLGVKIRTFPWKSPASSTVSFGKWAMALIPESPSDQGAPFVWTSWPN